VWWWQPDATNSIQHLRCARAGCATNYYKDTDGTCKACKGDATSSGGESGTCECAASSLQGTYDKTSGCGEGLALALAGWGRGLVWVGAGTRALVANPDW
jgi:hypothetical protein